MKLATQSSVTHHTTLVAADRPTLAAMLDLAHAERSTGKVTINLNRGGITSVTFEERRAVTQAELDEWDTLRLGDGGGAVTSYAAPLRTRDDAPADEKVAPAPLSA